MVEDAGWSSQQYPVMTHYSAVWGTSSSDVFAVGEFWRHHSLHRPVLEQDGQRHDK